MLRVEGHFGCLCSRSGLYYVCRAIIIIGRTSWLISNRSLSIEIVVEFCVPSGSYSRPDGGSARG